MLPYAGRSAGGSHRQGAFCGRQESDLGDTALPAYSAPSSAAVYACMKKYPVDGDGCVVGIFADDGRKFKSVYAKQNIMTEKEFDDALKTAKHMSELAY